MPSWSYSKGITPAEATPTPSTDGMPSTQATAGIQTSNGQTEVFRCPIGFCEFTHPHTHEGYSTVDTDTRDCHTTHEIQQVEDGWRCLDCDARFFLDSQEASVTIVKDGDAQCRYCGILADEEEQRHLTTCRFFRDSQGG